MSKLPFPVKLYLMPEERHELSVVELPGPVKTLLQPVLAIPRTDRRGEVQFTVHSIEVAQQAVDALEALAKGAVPFSYRWRACRYVADALRHYTAFRGGVHLARSEPLPGLAGRPARPS